MPARLDGEADRAFLARCYELLVRERAYDPAARSLARSVAALGIADVPVPSSRSTDARAERVAEVLAEVRAAISAPHDHVAALAYHGLDVERRRKAFHDHGRLLAGPRPLTDEERMRLHVAYAALREAEHLLLRHRTVVDDVFAAGLVDPVTWTRRERSPADRPCTGDAVPDAPRAPCANA